MEFKVGDRVLVFRQTMTAEGKACEKLTKVISASPKRGDLKIEGYDMVFDKSGHAKTRSAWSMGPWLELATDELVAEVKEKNKHYTNLYVIKSLETNKLTKKAAEVIASVIEDLEAKGSLYMKEDI